ncbi:MAG: PD-(D/E)XK nuclease family protein [Candidatus Cloacimonetes bacterium]|nr:PD-(D/E)XK nuclease family protein [Candidatus Cloacimonadota bacterium]
MSSEKQQLSISVRGLVEYYYRAGDLDLYTYSSSSRLRAGQRAHQKIQNRRGDEWEKEVYLRYIHEDEEFDLLIRGRIDCLQRNAKETRLEEIKTITRDPEQIDESSFNNWWGQVKIYGAILAEQEDLEKVNLQLTLYHLETKKEHILEQEFSREESDRFLKILIGHYLVWARKLADWQRKRNMSLQEFTFPFDSYRSGQREMAVKVYQAIQGEGQLLVEAPTGIGKTMAALFPALKAIGTGIIDRIFYLTARTTGKSIAAGTAGIMLEKGLQAKIIVLTAKDKICFNPLLACHPAECKYAKGFYDRLDSAIEDMFPYLHYSRELVEKISRKHVICPFEFSLLISQWSDVIIGDYNYAFDPRIYLRRFFEEKSENYTFLVDEAHNLVDRSREMFSFELEKGKVLALRRQVKGILPGIYKLLGKINQELLDKRKIMTADEEVELEKPDFLDKPLRQFQKAADVWLAQNIPSGFRSDFLELYFEINSFLSCLEYYDDCFRTLWRREKSELNVKLFCLDPSTRLAESLLRTNSVTFYSATLSPFHYYREIFGLEREVGVLQLASPFPPENLKVQLVNISTRYRQRQVTLPYLAAQISDFIRNQTGNTLIFFPSYAYLKKVVEKIGHQIDSHKILIQASGMTETEREEFLLQFSSGERVTGFAVMGGVFGEGIDLVGDKLEAIAVIGVGLPGIDLERELIRGYYPEPDKGYDFAYIYPGMTRVLQAAGRLIRTETDKGELLLIDDRFFHRKFRNLMPEKWVIGER